MISTNKGKREPLIIIGCGGHGRVVLDVLRNAGDYDVLGFVDSNPALHGRRVDGLEVLGPPEMLTSLHKRHGVSRTIVGVGNNGARRALAEQVQSWGFSLVNAIHPSANLAGNVTLGQNLVIAAGALVCAHCQIGDSAILNTGCIIDHESWIGTATHICPGARLAGRVAVESGAFVGIGATIIQGLRIGYESTIGAGAVVIHDVAPMSTVVGVPARPIRTLVKSASVAAGLVPEFKENPPVAPPIPVSRTR